MTKPMTRLLSALAAAIGLALAQYRVKPVWSRVIKVAGIKGE